MLKRFIPFAMLFAFTVPGTGAQGLYLGPQGGYQRSQDSDGGEFLGGLAFRAKLSSAFGAEASVLYRQEDFENGDVTVRSWPVMATGLFYPLPFLYASAGGGWFYTTFDYSSELNDAGTDDKTSSEFGWHFGGGVEIPLGSRVRIAGDIRYVFLDYDFEGLPGRDIDSNFYMVTLGVLFNLWGLSDDDF